MLRDVFGRDIRGHAIELVDWEGACANPALKLELVPDPHLSYPVRVQLNSANSRIEFNEPSTVDKTGATKLLTFAKAEPQTFWVSDFSDREAQNIETPLRIDVTDATGGKSSLELPMRIVSRERPDHHKPFFDILIDYGQDQTGFFEKMNKLARSYARPPTIGPSIWRILRSIKCRPEPKKRGSGIQKGSRVASG